MSKTLLKRQYQAAWDRELARIDFNYSPLISGTTPQLSIKAVMTILGLLLGVVAIVTGGILVVIWGARHL